METKNTCIINALLWGAGILLLLAAAFDVLPMDDNLVIFIALACFVVNMVIKKIGFERVMRLLASRNKVPFVFKRRQQHAAFKEYFQYFFTSALRHTGWYSKRHNTIF